MRSPSTLGAGMLDLQKAQEWVVTTKLGSSDKRPGTSAAPPRDCRFYAGEMAMSTFVLTAAFYGIFSINRWSFSIFLTLQGVPWVRPEALVCTDYATAWQVLSIIASSCWGAPDQGNDILSILSMLLCWGPGTLCHM